MKGLACAKCHAVSGVGGQVGPDLSGMAAVKEVAGDASALLKTALDLVQNA